MLTAGFLSRLQFAFAMSFHILFPAFPIGQAAWLVFLEALPQLAASCAVMVWRSVIRRREARPFVCAPGFFPLGLIGLVAGIWPNIVPPAPGIREAASPPSSQRFVPVGAAFRMPAVLRTRCIRTACSAAR
ncbi:MAG: cytochrome d ubiquinol oxidase subunit II [Xanthomonadaceae bacterium]|nr:cytochrome d ubiquinol oxidase subunit II [Xanthomonadaceae bacterium]MDE1962595.1 cytochrome d ubiquinol oxidase subunit II [Xanthomonadaceae bacterium]